VGKRQAHKHGLPVEEPQAVERSLQVEGPFKRMLDVSLRMNENRNPHELMRFHPG
jgi:hypothetical protein